MVPSEERYWVSLSSLQFALPVEYLCMVVPEPIVCIASLRCMLGRWTATYISYNKYVTFAFNTCAFVIKFCETKSVILIIFIYFIILYHFISTEYLWWAWIWRNLKTRPSRPRATEVHGVQESSETEHSVFIEHRWNGHLDWNRTQHRLQGTTGGVSGLIGITRNRHMVPGYTTVPWCHGTPLYHGAEVHHCTMVPRYTTVPWCQSQPLYRGSTVHHCTVVPKYTTVPRCHGTPLYRGAKVHLFTMVPRYTTVTWCQLI